MNKINERLLFRVSILCIILGLSFLYFYAEEFPLESVQNIEQLPRQEKVRIEGVITKLTKQNTAVFFEITGHQKITTPIIFFPTQDVYLKEGQYAVVEGLVEEYQQKKEIIASKVTIK